jgi:RecA-family ATPase
MAFYICSLPNHGEPGVPHECVSDDMRIIEAFAKREDKPGRGVYYCVSALRPGTRRRSLENIDEITVLHADIDAKDIVEDLTTVGRVLVSLPLRLTELRNSGHGYHAIIALKQPARTSDADEVARYNAVLKRVTEYFCGDKAVAHAVALLRWPGTHNSKNGEWAEVSRVMQSDAHYDLYEIEDWLDDVDSRPLFTRRLSGNGHDKEAKRSHGDISRPPIDVEARLAAMKLHGPGDSSIHQTQLHCSASLLRAGVALQEATRTVLDATRAAVANDPRWKWGIEELKILRMGGDFVAKNPELLPLLPDGWRQPFETALAQGHHPDIGRNHGGFYVRVWKNWKDSKGRRYRKSADTAEQQAEKEPNNEIPARVILKPFTPIDVSSLPRRQWLYGKHYQRGIVSATVAPGGTGKTSLVMVEGVALATGRNLLGEQPEERCRVWLHNGEDGLVELSRRVVAICQHYKIPQEELQGWLFLTSGTEMALKVANGYSDLKIDAALVTEMTRVIADNAIDVVMFDPLVTLHSVNESDNGKMDTLIRIFTKISDACGCSIDISHHTRKLAAGTFDHTVDDTRGASSVRDAVRMLRILNIMSHQDGENLGFDDFERLSYFRVDRGKANSVAPASSATWRKFVSVELANGDNVGVVTPWQLPASESVDDQERVERLFLQLLDQYSAGDREVNDRRHRHYAPKCFAEEAVARAARISRAKFEAAMSRLLAAGKIRAETYGRADRPFRRIVRVSQTIL